MPGAHDSRKAIIHSQASGEIRMRPTDYGAEIPTALTCKGGGRQLHLSELFPWQHSTSAMLCVLYFYFLGGGGVGGHSAGGESVCVSVCDMIQTQDTPVICEVVSILS